MEQKTEKNEIGFPFEKLEVWQCAVDLTDFVLKLMESFPSKKCYRVIGQMEMAVSGVPRNIAEGKGRQHDLEFIQFLYQAKGSLFEVLTLTKVLKGRGLIK